MNCNTVWACCLLALGKEDPIGLRLILWCNVLACDYNSILPSSSGISDTNIVLE